VPQERREDLSRLEIRFSPSVAAALVDALPYLAGYAYGCTEQTLNRFLPTLTVHNTVKELGIDLASLKEKQTNLNPQELGAPEMRASQWQASDETAVFDEMTVAQMARRGLARILDMQQPDRGWGWFAGSSGGSDPHMTAYVVHDLQKLRATGITTDRPFDDDWRLKYGIRWLKKHQRQKTRRLRQANDQVEGKEAHADNVDAFVFMVLTDEKVEDGDMLELLYRDRRHLSVYAKAMYGLALHKLGQTEKLAMVIRNIEQYLVRDEENDTAYLTLPKRDSWWRWYGNPFEAHAYYLKLLVRTEPSSAKTARVAKYLLNNRKNGPRWNSTRDTALCVEALAEFLKASGELTPDMTVEVSVDNDTLKTQKISTDNLFAFDNAAVLCGKVLSAGDHVVRIQRTGSGRVYCNAYLTTFTLADSIEPAGSEIKVARRYFRITKQKRVTTVPDRTGRPTDREETVERREPLEAPIALRSGDLIEVELEISSRNNCEHLTIEDFRAAGMEPIDSQSGYHGGGIGAFMEVKDNRTAFFVRHLRPGTHTLSYRARAEIPGNYSALPARVYAMYAPELRANSGEAKIQIAD